MRIRQSELRKLWHRKKEAHKIRVASEGGAKAAAKPAVDTSADAKSKAPRKKKEEAAEE